MRTRLTNNGLAVAVATTFVLLCSSPSRANLLEPPTLVFPSLGETEVVTITPCPTLSWSGVDRAQAYEVQLLESVDGAEKLVPLESVIAEGRSWTPSPCLDEGRDFAWRARARLEGESSEWTPEVRFRVAADDTLEAALQRVASRLIHENRLSLEELDWLRQLGLDDKSRGSLQPRIGAGPRVKASESLTGPPHPLHSFGSVSLHIEAEDAHSGVVTIGTLFGILAEGSSLVGPVAGRATAVDGENAGVFGRNYTDIQSGAPVGTASIGVLGVGRLRGARGTSVAPGGRGVRGLGSSRFGFNQGVLGEVNSTSGTAVEGRAVGTTGTNYGVRSRARYEFSSIGFDFYAGGNGTDYGPFTGSHLARVDTVAGEIQPGMVVSVTGAAEARSAPDGSISLSATLPTVRLATESYDPRVLGAFVAEAQLEPESPWLEQGTGRIAIVNALGEGRIWVSNANGPVRAGDYLTSSSFPGYAQRQGDSALAAHTVAKATETIDWSKVTETISNEGVEAKAALIAVVYTGG